MLNVLLLGATGTAGKAIAEKLLSHTDCRLTLFARHAKDMWQNNSRITVIDGDAEKLSDLKDVLIGQDVVYCAISGEALPKIAENLIAAMPECDVTRLIFMGAVGIYNEIPDKIDGKDNVANNPDQIPNRDAVEIIEASKLNYTILRPGYLRDGDENDYVITLKGQEAKGFITTIPSIVNLAVQLILDSNLYSGESVCITRDADIRKDEIDEN